MDEENRTFGVFFRADGGEEYLIATAKTEDIAEDMAGDFDEEDYYDALDEHDGTGPRPKLEDFQGRHYTGLISRDLVNDELLLL